MDASGIQLCSAFEGDRLIASGEVRDVALKAKEVLDREEHGRVLIFDDDTSRPVEIDFRGSAEDVLARLPRPDAREEAPQESPSETRRGPGRPKLGVVAREVTLLPRHWEWLSSQPGGASVALRKLVEEARRANQHADRIRRSQESAYRFMTAMAGDAPGFEEATRALFAGDRARFDELVGPWPTDVREHARRLAAAALGAEPDA